MRLFAAMAVLLAGASGAWAQRHGGGMMRVPQGITVQGTLPFRTFGSPTGFGNILFPGTGTQPPLTNPFSTPSSFVTRFGATISGFPGYTGAPSGGFRRGRGGAAYPMIYPVPVYVGGYDAGYGYAQQAQPNVTIVMPPQQYQAQQMPPVTINQTFVPQGAKPTVTEYPQPEEGTDSGPRTYSAPTPPPSAPVNDQVLFLVALKDATVYTAVAYWVEGETLHYVTPQGRHNQVSLDLVDRDVSARLNQGRQVEFRLPPAKH